MTRPRPKVELHEALVWTCDDCGRDNYENCIQGDVDLSDDEKAELRKVFGLEPGDSARIGMECQWVPLSVECGHCGAEFQSELRGAGGEGDGQ